MTAGASTSASSTTQKPATNSNGARHVGARPVASGTVKAVGTDTFTLTTPRNTVVTVDVNGTTTYRDRGIASPTLGNVTVGSHVAVAGTDTSNTITATNVHIGGHRSSNERGGSRPAATGTVKTIGTNTFTLTTRVGAVVTVNVNSTTTYLDRGITSPTLNNVTVGSHVAVTGTDTSNTITATKVLVAGERGRLGGGSHGGAWRSHGRSQAPSTTAA